MELFSIVHRCLARQSLGPPWLVGSEGPLQSKGLSGPPMGQTLKFWDIRDGDPQEWDFYVGYCFAFRNFLAKMTMKLRLSSKSDWNKAVVGGFVVVLVLHVGTYQPIVSIPLVSRHITEVMFHLLSSMWPKNWGQQVKGGSVSCGHHSQRV